MHSLWILGYGPLLVDSQFIVDYKRLQMTFDGKIMPSDVREGVRLLYDKLGVKYFTFTKYMNQTLGNYGYEAIKKLTDDHVVVNMPSIRVHACSIQCSIQFSFVCNILNSSLQPIHLYFVQVTMNMKTYKITVDCRVYK